MSEATWSSASVELNLALGRLEQAGGSAELCRAVIDIAINAANHETVKLQVQHETEAAAMSSALLVTTNG